MTRTLGLAVVVGGMGVVPVGPAAAQQPRGPAVDSAAVHAFWAEVDSIWHTRDADRFSRLFAEDASFGFVDRGHTLDSHADIHRHFTGQFARQRPGLHHATRVQAIRSLAPGTVLVDGEVRILDGLEEGSTTVLRRLAITAVLVREAGEYRIRVLRAYTLPPADPRPDG